MPVPEEIRRVKRPVNTVVVDSGCKGCRQYAVRERARSVYVPGGNPQPRNGKVIGHIWQGQYVPVVSEPSEKKPEMLSYGSSALVKSVLNDVYDDLLSVFPLNDAVRIMAVAALKVIRPSISCARMSTHYNRTFISKFYPEAGLSRNTISAFLQRLGQSGALRQKFYQRRISAVANEHHIAIDGMLKQNTSTVNDLSKFSYKSRVKGGKDISLLYAYDIELQEPICAEVFPGNSIDAASYKAFIRDNDIKKGIIVADKGFPPSCIKNELEHRPELHFLTPIKRNDTRIIQNRMLAFDHVLSGISEEVLSKKCCIK